VQLTNRSADRPGAEQRPGGVHRVVLLDEGHDLAGALTAAPVPSSQL